MKASEISLVFPNQLFKHHPALEKNRPVYLVEEWLFFRQFSFHKQKLLLHRASMKCYQNWLEQNGFRVIYVDSIEPNNDSRALIEYLASQHITAIHMVDPVDDWLSKRVRASCKKNLIRLQEYPNPNFLNTLESAKKWMENRKSYFQTDFYIKQRKAHHILLDDDGKPTGNKWTFDAENRERFPKNGIVPSLKFPAENKIITEARSYVQQHFEANQGLLHQDSLFAVSFEDAENCLQEFLSNRFEKFGVYEDAIVAKESVLHHSVLSPMLNIGLLNPKQIIDAALLEAQRLNIPINSVEGFVRQIIGWREFIRVLYELEGSRQRTKNFWQFKRKIPAKFWKGNTGILPIDRTIQKINQTGYCHHIERLMVLGNFMLLCEFDPDEVYRWFMEMFIDAYDWVMVPNVYGMTQFADGGLMCTKPYISSSNYLMKLSDYEKGDWQLIWDGLFWRFMHTHRAFFLKNPRLGMLIKTFDKMSPEKRQMHLENANTFLHNLDE